MERRIAPNVDQVAEATPAAKFWVNLAARRPIFLGFQVFTQTRLAGESLFRVVDRQPGRLSASFDYEEYANCRGKRMRGMSKS